MSTTETMSFFRWKLENERSTGPTSSARHNMHEEMECAVEDLGERITGEVEAFVAGLAKSYGVPLSVDVEELAARLAEQTCRRIGVQLDKAYAQFKADFVR